METYVLSVTFFKKQRRYDCGLRERNQEKGLGRHNSLISKWINVINTPSFLGLSKISSKEQNQSILIWAIHRKQTFDWDPEAKNHLS